jgi:hypothetical protein
MYEYRCDEGGLEHLNIETRLIDESPGFGSVMGECDLKIKTPHLS